MRQDGATNENKSALSSLKKELAMEVTPLSWGNLQGFSIRDTIFHYLAS